MHVQHSNALENANPEDRPFSKHPIAFWANDQMAEMGNAFENQVSNDHYQPATAISNHMTTTYEY